MSQKWVSLFFCAAALLLLSGCFLFVLPDEPSSEIANAAKHQPGKKTYHLYDDDWFCALQIFLPAKTTKPVPAAIIFPGGAYGVLDFHVEGTEYAKFLAANGVAGIVVKYPLGSIFGHFRRHPAMQQAAQHTVRLIRIHAKALNIDPAKVGTMGSSAGGHLAALTALGNTEGEKDAADPVKRFSAKPDFVIMCYPVVTMDTVAHKTSRSNLLGSNPTQEQIDALSLEKQVAPGFPPTFLWLTLEDQCVDPENGKQMDAALKKHNIPHKTLIFQHGPHGMGLLNEKQKQLYPETAAWSGELLKFLQEQKILNHDGKREEEI
ncbi:MAG: alpha/beta hydrolase [Lentisphaeria bacterium]|nr:alpha/beta hydrolase [Lentisphaeria bacterium]